MIFSTPLKYIAPTTPGGGAKYLGTGGRGGMRTPPKLEKQNKKPE